MNVGGARVRPDIRRRSRTAHRLRHGPAAGNEQCRPLASGVVPANRAHECVDVSPWPRQTCPFAWSDGPVG
eukprot:6146652-Prymnesium_polylepis.1